MIRMLNVLLALALVPAAARAQGDPDISGTIEGSGFTRIKIAVPDAEPGPGSAEAAAEIAQTIRDDLEFTGLFDLIDPALYRLVPASSGDTPKHDDWLAIGADAVVQVRVTIANQRIDAEARLHDNPSKTMTFARRYGGSESLLRRVAHQISDDIVEKYTGRPGVAMTRMAFVSKHGQGKEIYLMDYDGKRVRRLTTSATINLSPAWSPDGEELAFVSWRSRQPGVFLMSAEGELRELRTVGGELSSAPEWAPDGRRMAYSSDVDGNTEIYLLDRERNQNRRLTHHAAIDTAPAFAPNGREIAFTSDRSGSPQIYVMDIEGLNVRRITWNGNYNDSAAWSPSGDRMLYASRLEGKFHIVVSDLTSDRQTQLTSGNSNNENPRWSPDGRHIVFASDRGGTYDIYTMRADGSDVRRLTRGVDSYTPDWSR